MRSRTILLAALALALVLPGCVAKKKYVALQAEHDATVEASAAQAIELQRQLSESQAQAAMLKSSLDDANAARATLSQDLSTSTQQREALEANLAEMLKDRSRLKTSVDVMQAALAEQAQRQAEAERRIAEYRDLTARFKELIDAGTLRVRIVDGRMVVQLSSDILFASGSAKLSKEGEASIAQVAAILATMGDRSFQIEGHTDNVPIATAEYPSNWELGFARAMTVVSTMQAGGMPPGRLSAASFGENRPTAPNDTKEGKAQNRRIEIVLVPDLSSLPGFEELNELSAGQAGAPAPAPASP